MIIAFNKFHGKLKVGKVYTDKTIVDAKRICHENHPFQVLRIATKKEYLNQDVPGIRALDEDRFYEISVD